MSTTSESTKENKLKDINKGPELSVIITESSRPFYYLRFFVSETIRDKAPSTTAAMDR